MNFYEIYEFMKFMKELVQKLRTWNYWTSTYYNVAVRVRISGLQHVNVQKFYAK